MKALLEEYLSVYSLKVGSGTLLRVRGQLRRFVQSLRGGEFPTQDHLRAWRLTLVRQGLKAYTIQGSLGSVRGFLDWLYGQGYLLVNPWPKEWDEARVHPACRRFPSEQKTRALLDAALENGSAPIRDRAVLELAYGTGLRRAELSGLNVSDLKGDGLFVRGKGGHERVVPLSATARAWLMRYLVTERANKAARFNPHEDALFLSYRGRRIGPQSFSYLFQRRQAHQDGFSLHSLRHACASHMLAHGASIVVLQKLLGHRKLSTTQIYTQVETDSLRSVLDRFHPRG